jgi:hypothetical protein
MATVMTIRERRPLAAAAARAAPLVPLAAALVCIVAGALGAWLVAAPCVLVAMSTIVGVIVREVARRSVWPARERWARLDFASEGIRIDGRLAIAAAGMGACVTRPDGVVRIVDQNQNPLVEIVAGADAAEIGSTLEATYARPRRYAFDGTSPASPAIWISLMCALPCVLAALGEMHLGRAPLSVVVWVLWFVALGALPLHGRVDYEVGADGVHVRGRRSRFVSFTEVRDVARRGNGVRLALTDGTKLDLPTPLFGAEDRQREVLERIASALAAFRGQAALLRARGDAEAGPRLRVVAEAVASPELRVALEADDEEAALDPFCAQASSFGGG